MQIKRNLYQIFTESFTLIIFLSIDIFYILINMNYVTPSLRSIDENMEAPNNQASVCNAGYTAKNEEPVLGLMKTTLSNVLLHTLFKVINNIVQPECRLIQAQQLVQYC